MKSVSVKDVDQHKFVRALAAFFKKSGKVKQPGPTPLVKTAVFKELAPFDEDWFLIRMASLVRHPWSRQLSSRNLLLLMKTGSSFAWPPWSDTLGQDSCLQGTCSF